MLQNKHIYDVTIFYNNAYNYQVICQLQKCPLFFFGCVSICAKPDEVMLWCLKKLICFCQTGLGSVVTLSSSCVPH